MDSPVRTLSTRRNMSDHWPRMFPDQAPSGGLSAKNITFVVTEACPLRCTYCYECSKRHDVRMSWEVAKAGVDMILHPALTNGYVDLEQDKMLICEFIGGEPLLEASLMLRISRYLKQQLILLDHPWKNHFMFSISTNGVPYRDPAFAQFLRENRGRVSISVTVDGDKQLHDSCRVFPDGSGSYEDAVAAVNFIRNYCAVDATKVTIAPGNLEYLSSAIPHLFGLGFTDINANTVYEEGWTVEHARLFYRELVKLADWMVETKTYETSYCSLFDQTIGQFQGPEQSQNWCGGTGQMLAIGPDGKLWPCLRYMPFALQNARPEMSIGTVWTGVEAEETNPCRSCMKCITRQSQSTQECLECPVSAGCGWCSAYHYDLYGTPDKRCTAICWMHRARCMANFYYWDRIRQETGFDAGVSNNVELLHQAIILEEEHHGM